MKNKFKVKELLLISLPVVAMLIITGFIYWLLIYRKEHQLVGLLLSEIQPIDVFWCVSAVVCSLGIVFAFLKIFPKQYLHDPNVKIMADSYSLGFFAIYFIPNAFYEELLFRGTLQPLFGLVPASILFTAIHFSYYKKPLLLVNVFLQGIVLGLLFHVTNSIWITTLAHTTINFIQMWLIKSGRIKY